MKSLLILLTIVMLGGCVKSPGPYVPFDAARPELPDAGEEGDASLPEAGTDAGDAGTDAGDAG